jgi:hypothetical protein
VIRRTGPVQNRRFCKRRGYVPIGRARGASKKGACRKFGSVASLWVAFGNQSVVARRAWCLDYLALLRKAFARQKGEHALRALERAELA